MVHPSSSARRSRPRIGGGGRNNGPSLIDCGALLLFALWTSGAFYVGVLAGMRFGGTGSGGGGGGSTPSAASAVVDERRIEALVNDRVRTELAKRSSRLGGGGGGGGKGGDRGRNNNKDPRFPETMSRYATGAARTTKNDFLSNFDYGIPVPSKSFPKAESGQEEVLILYNSDGALPSDAGRADSAKYDDGTGQLPLLGALDATANCETINVVSTNSPGGNKQCLAIVGNYESYHVQRWMRIPTSTNTNGGGGSVTGKIDKSLPLVPVGRGAQSNGQDKFRPPSDADVLSNWSLLKKYLESLEETTSQLRPILQRIAVNNAVVVMVCNMGQSELLLNFACAAKARGFEIKNVLVFATDKGTYDLATGVGLTAFYDEKNFGDMPEKEAKFYGDKVFTQMMYAKVICVQLVNYLGYDLLFQDVDIVWYKNPLDFFHDKTDPHYDFDILFQDDGAKSVRYAPYSANSGFYYVRNNPRTRALFRSLLYYGDMILSTNSHQQALAALLPEHASLFGLRVKTLGGEDFPGGFHYHRKKEHPLIRRIVEGTHVPWLFHMSWTTNKDNKLLFFKQMGLWYVREECEGGKSVGALGALGGAPETVTEEFTATCCSAEPIITCHYRDKPSVIPCNDSPPIDKNGKSFWEGKR